jgi:hypothetical protein
MGAPQGESDKLVMNETINTTSRSYQNEHPLT